MGDYITLAAAVLNNELVFSLLILILVFLTEKDFGKRKKILLALFLAGTLGWTIKEVIQAERPCISMPGLIDCPFGFSFPSLHAMVSFTLAISYLDKREFPLILIFALFVSFSRIYLGVHGFFDVSAGLALGAVCYGIVDYYFRRDAHGRKK